MDFKNNLKNITFWQPLFPNCNICNIFFQSVSYPISENASFIGIKHKIIICIWIILDSISVSKILNSKYSNSYKDI